MTELALILAYMLPGALLAWVVLRTLPAGGDRRWEKDRAMVAGGPGDPVRRKVEG